ncbi:gdsl family lipase [Leptolyngbya sp. Heron Island J]|uniref:SGNH/GDSL hydrolase family protein n=1 Tax=Leptolyngbya sp. Heron Island J TaxID=1385935 RepID=UPI0003B97227|nr:SGNH/GDSL hydrolase family protein [Leptolyngbya sp. Heron Island J]ESA37048.1 gdsl family lipase [Leptolyngbya sp. Heron Island J]
MKKKLLAAGGVILSCLISPEARADSFTGLNIFGDSLVDSGNLFNTSDALFSPLGLPAIPPSPPYDQKNSNGPIWVENLADALGLSPTLVTDLVLNPTTTPPPTQGINFAFSGALSSDTHILDDDLQFLATLFPELQDLVDNNPFLGFEDQLDAFTALSTIVPVDPNALNIIWVGANDYNEAFFNPTSLGGVSQEELPNVVTDNIIDGITRLSDLGAQEFLVVNLPDIGAAPFADFLDAESPLDIPEILNGLAFTHNELLSAKLDIFGTSRPDTTITTLDVNTLFADILTAPDEFGLTNVDESCLINFQPGFAFDGICDNPDEFFFWDNTHPTTAAYTLVSDLALATLNERTTSAASVPEPSALAALLAMGIMGAGTLARRPQSDRTQPLKVKTR